MFLFVGTLLLLSISPFFPLSSLSLSPSLYTFLPCLLLGWPTVGCRPHHREEPLTEAQTRPLAAAVWQAVLRPHADHLLVRGQWVAGAANQTLPKPVPSPSGLRPALLH